MADQGGDGLGDTVACLEVAAEVSAKGITHLGIRMIDHGLAKKNDRRLDFGVVLSEVFAVAFPHGKDEEGVLRHGGSKVATAVGGEVEAHLAERSHGVFGGWLPGEGGNSGGSHLNAVEGRILRGEGVGE